MSHEDITHVSDTALMAAACRALETARPDGFVRDPFAERLAGPRGMAIARALPRLETMEFGIGARSRFMDEFVMLAVKDHAITTVVSVGSGLDSRPWRLDLPSELRWIEADLRPIMEYKDAVMSTERPKCRLERIPTDLNDPTQRSALFAAAGEAPGLMITEGLLMYLPGATIEALAADPPAVSGIRYWLTDLVSPAFALLVGMDSFRQIQDVRAAEHLDGDGILAAMRKHGWSFLHQRRYVTEIWGFAVERIKKAAERVPKAEPAARPTPDDFTGVHILKF
jgi:methyltransferase (TIGR00027 family)